MRARAIAVVAVSLALASCVDSERLRNNLGGPETSAAEARQPAQRSALASEEKPSLAKRDASR